MSETVFQLSSNEISNNITIAYEPILGNRTGQTASVDQAQEMHRFIRNLFERKYGFKISNNISILYGGSCNPSNSKDLFSCEDVDGGLIGGASLKSDDFVKIINSFLMEYIEFNIKLNPRSPFSEILSAKLNEIDFEAYVEEGDILSLYSK